MVLLRVGKCFCQFCDSGVYSASNVFSQIMVLLHIGKCIQSNNCVATCRKVFLPVLRLYCTFCFKRIQSNNGVATCRKVFLQVLRL